MTQQEERRTVTILVEKKAEGKEGLWEVIAAAGLFGSKYPTTFNRVPKADADQVTIGKQANVVLAKGNQRSKSEPTRDYDWWWNWRGLAPAGAEPTPAAKPTSAPAPAEKPVTREDPTRRSIERQTALIQAVAFAGHCMSAGQGQLMSTELVLAVAREFLGFVTEAKAEPKAAMPEGQEPTPEQAMQLRAATLAKANGLKPFGLMDWCQDPSHAALPTGTKWADATLEQKTRALDIFEAAHQEAKP